MAIRENHQRRIGKPDVLIGVPFDEVVCTSDIDCFEGWQVPGTTGQLAQRGEFSLHPSSRRQQVVEFGEYVRRHDERPGIGIDGRTHRPMVRVVLVEVGNQTTGTTYVTSWTGSTGLLNDRK